MVRIIKGKKPLSPEDDCGCNKRVRSRDPQRKKSTPRRRVIRRNSK